MKIQGYTTHESIGTSADANVYRVSNEKGTYAAKVWFPSTYHDRVIAEIAINLRIKTALADRRPPNLNLMLHVTQTHTKACRHISSD